jgi:hypothetical protein
MSHYTEGIEDQMIQAVFGTDKGPIGIIGINQENMIRMQAGMPLRIDLKALTPPGMRMNQVIVHYAHTYLDVINDLEKGGLPVTEEFRQTAQEMDARLEREKRERDPDHHP